MYIKLVLYVAKPQFLYCAHVVRNGSHKYGEKSPQDHRRTREKSNRNDGGGRYCRRLRAGTNDLRQTSKTVVLRREGSNQNNGLKFRFGDENIFGRTTVTFL